MQLTLEIPGSEAIPADQVAEGAARGVGWTDDHPLAAADYLVDHLEQYILDRFRGHRVAAAADEVARELPRASRILRAEQAREEERRREAKRAPEDEAPSG